MVERAPKVAQPGSKGPGSKGPGPKPDKRAPLRRRASMMVGRVDDPAEREPDRLADQVIGRLMTQVPGTRDVDAATTGTRIHRSTVPMSGAAGAGGGPLEAETESRIRSSSGQGLDNGTRGRMESAFGRDLGNVRIHRNSAVAPSISAAAFTVGSDIHFAPGNFQPGTPGGDHLLAHELAHVVQGG